MKKIIIIIITLIAILSIFIILITTPIPKPDIYGTYFGEGDLGSVIIIVEENTDVIKYYFTFTDNFVKQLLKSQNCYLKFVANTEFNIPHLINNYDEDSELLYRGVFRGNIRKPFTLLNFRMDSYDETIELYRVEQ